MSKMPWFRLHTDIIDDEKVRLLAFEDRWHFVALMCCKRAGLLDKGDAHDLLRRKLSVKLGLASREFEAAVMRIAEVGLICHETFQPLAWDDRQFISDSSAERVRRHRDRVKQDCNVTVTAPETDTEPDDKAGSTASAAKKRGTRLPDDWHLATELMVWATEATGNFDYVQREIEKFKDYWKACAGAKGVKLDWDATFRNWIRNALSRGSYGKQTGEGVGRSAIDRVSENVRRANQTNGYGSGPVVDGQVVWRPG